MMKSLDVKVEVGKHVIQCSSLSERSEDPECRIGLLDSQVHPTILMV